MPGCGGINDAEKKMEKEKEEIEIGIVGEAMIASLEKKTGLTMKEIGDRWGKIKKEMTMPEEVKPPAPARDVESIKREQKIKEIQLDQKNKKEEAEKFLHFLIKKDDDKKDNFLALFYLPELLKGRYEAKIILPIIGELREHGKDYHDYHVKERNHRFGEVIMHFRPKKGKDVEIIVDKASNRRLAEILFHRRPRDKEEKKWGILFLDMKGEDILSIRHGLIRESLKRALKKAKTARMSKALSGRYFEGN
ncbi:MAG: hypothetical protein AAB474_03065 [Patescibacteria group bacterium]